MTKYARWLWWTIYYAVTPKPQGFNAIMAAIIRQYPPWRTFTPNAFHNIEGKCWLIYLDDESDYTVTNININCEVMVGQETGRIVGFDITDRELERVAETVRRP